MADDSALVRAGGARFNVSEATFARAMNVDYVELARAGRRIADALTPRPAPMSCSISAVEGDQRRR